MYIGMCITHFTSLSSQWPFLLKTAYYIKFTSISFLRFQFQLNTYSDWLCMNMNYLEGMDSSERNLISVSWVSFISNVKNKRNCWWLKIEVYAILKWVVRVSSRERFSYAWKDPSNAHMKDPFNSIYASITYYCGNLKVCAKFNAHDS